MSERNLTRKLSASVVDALKSRGHILVVKGGATALAREVDELMAPLVATIEPRLKPRAPMGGEPTSTFGDEGVDEAVEEMVARVTRALMESEHVEDVFAEDNVIRRDIFRAVRDGILEPPGQPDADEDATVAVRLESLGYVAATVSKRGNAETLRVALEQAGAIVDAQLVGYNADLREAMFRLEGGGPDKRLELEEAVADELTDLVEQGIVELPTIERRIDAGRIVQVAEQRALRIRIESAAEETLHRSGCAVTWEFVDTRTMKITFTPLSDQDGDEIDPPTSAFAHELSAILASSEARPKTGQEAKSDAAVPAELAPPRATAPAEPAEQAPRPRPGSGRSADATSSGGSSEESVETPSAVGQAAEGASLQASASPPAPARTRRPKAKTATPAPAAPKRTASKRTAVSEAPEPASATPVAAPNEPTEPAAASPSRKKPATNGTATAPTTGARKRTTAVATKPPAKKR